MNKVVRKPAQGMQFETGLTGTPYATLSQQWKINHWIAVN